MKKLIASRFVFMGGLIAILVGCQTSAPPPKQKVESYKEVAKTSPSGAYVRPLKDGAPWWDVDVSNIPNATPMPHNGNYKNAPYKVLGKSYSPLKVSNGYKETGTASWYGTKFHGQATANGEHYDLYGMTAAHKTLPLPSYVKVTNLENNRTVILRVNDRGPFYSDRIIDLSFAAAKKLGYAEKGVARVHVEAIDPAQWLASQGLAVPKSEAHAQEQLAARNETKSAPSLETIVKERNPQYIETNAGAELNKALTGLYLQVGAFANPNAAELLKDQLIELTRKPVFISSVTQGAQKLYRVRLGPLPNQDEMYKTQDRIRVANLGQPRPVTLD